MHVLSFMRHTHTHIRIYTAMCTFVCMCPSGLEPGLWTERQTGRHWVSGSHERPSELWAHPAYMYTVHWEPLCSYCSCTIRNMVPTHPSPHRLQYKETLYAVCMETFEKVDVPNWTQSCVYAPDLLQSLFDELTRLTHVPNALMPNYCIVF